MYVYTEYTDEVVVQSLKCLQEKRDNMREKSVRRKKVEVSLFVD